MNAATTYTVQELQACVLAREIHPGDVGGMPGVRSEVQLAALCLAARTHAPDLVVYGIHGELRPASLSLTGTSSDFQASSGSLHRTSLATFFDLLQGGSLNWIFYGGMQIDQFGNVNLSCVGEHGRPRFRGPGTAGGNSTNFADRTFVWITEHTPRVFVKRVDFVCAAGYGDVDREGWKMSGLGLSPIVTPLCIMRIDPHAGRIVLVSRHPGVSLDEIVRNTGFELVLASQTPETIPPTDQELSVLRNEVDPLGILRGGVK
jgi:glutaconate CoA-transferase subunit B